MRLMATSSVSCVFFSFFSFLVCSTAVSIIAANQSINDVQSLLSADEIFELGFFSPNNSRNRYAGIWYHKIPEQTVVWVANRENPLSDSSGVITIQHDGNLVVLDGSNTTIWSTNTSIGWNYPSAELLDTGNLVLKQRSSNNSEIIIWQSFNHPSNTLLPGMKLGINLRTGEKRFLVSWRNSSDPALGTFSYGIDGDDANQFFIWKGSTKYWRSGYWNGRSFNQIPGSSNSFIFHFNIFSNQDEAYFEYSALYNNTRLVMDVTGELRCMIWYDTSQTWGLAWLEPKDPCSTYAPCGVYGRCSNDETPKCDCLPGFDPVSPTDWSSGNWSGGCTRRSMLACGGGDGFVSLGKWKVPDHETAVVAGSIEECRSVCLANCSCKAYVYANMSGGGGASTCLVWFGDLIDIAQLRVYEGEQEVYIRVAASELSPDRKRPLGMIIAVSTAGGIITLGAFFFCLWRNKVNKKGTIGRSFHSGSSALLHNDLLQDNKFKEEGNEGLDLPFFSFECIEAATDNFSDTNKVGEGGFGAVYKGKLPGGQDIAVKRLSRCSGQGLEELKNEIILIAKLQHRNLVRLLGYCIQGDEKMLVYEYMPNKSLDFFLFDQNQSGILNWEKRFSIILGVTRGLLYLHQDSRLRIIHRDLKTGNILLNEEMNAKISDFGLARIFGEHQTQGKTRRVVGTYGYMSPEYALDGLFSVKSDVFSFGVILLEIISGKKNTDFFSSEHSLSLLGYAWKLWKEDKGLNFLDPAIGESFNSREVVKCIQVGLLCVQEDTTDRPDMATILTMLVSDTTLSIPKQPASFVRRYHCEAESSKNEITITSVEGR